MKHLLWFAVVIMLMAYASFGMAQDQTPQSLLPRLAAQVSACDAERRTLESQLGDVAAQRTTDAEAIRASFKKQIETANPGKTLDAAWKIVDTQTH